MIDKKNMYDWQQISSDARIDGSVFFDDLKDDPTGQETAARFYSGAQNLLTDFDQRWIALCDGDVGQLTEWANHVRFIQKHLDELGRQVAVKGTRLFNWEKTAEAMGWINAFRVIVEQVIVHNERLRAKAVKV